MDRSWLSTLCALGLTTGMLEASAGSEFLVPPEASTIAMARQAGADSRVLSHVVAHPVFWGSDWRGTVKPSAATLSAAVSAFVASPYLAGLSEYADTIGTGHSTAPVVYDREEPNAATDQQGVEQFLLDRMDDRTLTGFEDDALYIVFLPPGRWAMVDGTRPIFSDGFHYYVVRAGKGGGSRQIPYVIVTMSSPETTLADVTDTLSHEIVEAVSNPFKTGVYGRWSDPDGVAGGDCSASRIRTVCEVADVCAGQRPKAAVGDVVYAYWWSQRASRCVAPGLPVPTPEP
jgi:hypothetical protein